MITPRLLPASILAGLLTLLVGCASSAPDIAQRTIPAPPDTAFVSHPQGRSVVMHDGTPVALPTYCDYILWKGIDDWKKRVEDFARSGTTVFMLELEHEKTDYFDSPFWTDENVYPAAEREVPTNMDAQAKFILSLVPNAKFYVRTWVSPPLTWCKKFPGEIQTDEDGKDYRQATISSPAYIAGITTALRGLVSYCEGQPWGDRVIGYLPAPLGEGVLPLNCAGKMFDCSPAAERDFRAWLRKKYATDADLQKAWGDAKITLDSAKVPRDAQWYAKRANSIPSLNGKPLTESQPANVAVARLGLFHWIEPAVAAAEHDYCYFQRDSFTHWFRSMAAAIKEAAAAKGRKRLVAFDICKQPLLGWQILSAFDGAGDNAKFPNILQLSGSFDVAELLDDKNIDALFTPADYHARTVGFAFEPEGPADSMVLRGKTLLTENDARTYVGAGIKDQGAFRDAVEVEAGLLRNEALALSRNFHSYWCNVGSSYFHDAKIQETVAKLVPALNRAQAAPYRETPDAIAFILDDSGPMYEDFSAGFQSIAVIWQRIAGLAHCGVPYRIYMLSDLKRDNFPNYKVYFFPNLFCVNDDVLALLHKKVLRDGNLAIFGPGTGITDGKKLSAEPATKLLGVQMELVPRTTERRVIVQEPRGQNCALVRDLPAGLTFGDTFAYGPTLVPDDRAVEKAGAVSLGMANTCFFINRTGMFLRESGAGAAGNGKPGARSKDDYAMLWSVAAPLPPGLLREAARYAGCNIWSEENDVVYASDSFVGVHTVKAGVKTIRFPRPMNVTDAMTGERIARGVREIKLKMDAVSTRLLLLE